MGYKQVTSRERRAADRARHIRERSGPDSWEWVQSALFLYAAHQEGLGGDLRRAIWAYTAAMVDKLERILTESGHIVGAQDLAEEYRWTARQLRVAITKHLGLLKMFEGEPDVTLPPVTGEGKEAERLVHSPTGEDAAAALHYVKGEFKQKHPGYDAVIPKADPDLI